MTEKIEQIRGRALSLLDDLICQETRGRRVNRSDNFLTTRVQNPSSKLFPEQWALDWCEGWAFHVPTAFADALGVVIAPRVKTVSEKDASGKVKKIKEHYSVWVQSTNFAFRTGYVLHQSEEDVWNKQLRHNPCSIQIEDALEASSGNARMVRDSGFVIFRRYEPTCDNAKMKPVSKHILTQDDFVRYLITGVMPQELDEDLTKR